MEFDSDDKKTIGCGCLIVLLIGLIFCSRGVINYATAENITITVKKIDREAYKASDGGRYVIYTPNEVFENRDTIWYWKFDSSDVQNKIDEGATYNAKVCGIRWPFFSWYRNIITIEKVTESKTNVKKSKIERIEKAFGEEMSDTEFRKKVGEIIHEE